MTNRANTLWSSLGFASNPYDARPWKPTPEDAELLVGREREGIEFSTILEAAPEGVCLISGPPGVGKTSFFNIQQYRLNTGLGAFGLRLLVTESPCSITHDPSYQLA